MRWPNSDQERQSAASKHRSLFLTAITWLQRTPARSCVIVLSLVAILSPFVTAIAVCEGEKDQYRRALAESADIYVARDHYGSNGPIELTLVDRLKAIQGVTRVVPRVIGRTYAKQKFVAVLGVHSQDIPSSITLEQGRKPGARGETIIGATAAAYLDLKPGSRFSLKRNPDQVFEIVGVFRSPFTVWEADLLVMNFDDASELFGIPEKATDLLVYTRRGYQQIVDIIIRMSEQEQNAAQPPLRAQTREIIERYSQRGFNIKAGVFSGFYSLVFLLGIPSIGVISGFGLSERRREIGVMKALGWQTEEVLELVALENLMLSVISMPFVMLVAAGWIHLFNAGGIASFFIADLDLIIPFQVPSQLYPVPCLLGVLMAVVLTMVGSIYATWRTAVVPPSEAMKT